MIKMNRCANKRASTLKIDASSNAPATMEKVIAKAPVNKWRMNAFRLVGPSRLVGSNECTALGGGEGS